ncbi:hypothetical protein WICPIJ_007624 [Wickerhamomyces pijperi]|uniref:RRM domain-containing protein n=1 Tax=Wickerhamomyces pijperi TaxID=599730 RepID=A0A9P8TJ24_WICPI|nr:hypothetical protein WICPIJ_007624 [Wickerhamomyces pijperi]
MSIIVSNVPQSVTQEEVSQFFQFCGKIESIEQTDSSKGTYKVTFSDSSALTTAALLNGAQLGGASVAVETLADGKKVEDSATKSDDASADIAQNGDIPQELKPKSQIFAEYLSQGYVLGDSLIGKAVEYDQKNGLSDKFNRFIGDLNTKYNLPEKQQQLQQTTEGLDNKYKVTENLTKYYNNFQQTSLGNKIHHFYTKAVNDSLQIHEEAKRLAEIKKTQAAAQGALPATTGNVAELAGQVPISKE